MTFLVRLCWSVESAVAPTLSMGDMATSVSDAASPVF